MPDHVTWTMSLVVPTRSPSSQPAHSLIAEYIWDWHVAEGCHKHADASVAEGVCCVCDAEDPCKDALDESVDYNEWACSWRTRGVRCRNEATHSTVCGDHLAEHMEGLRYEALLARLEARAGR